MSQFPCQKKNYTGKNTRSPSNRILGQAGLNYLNQAQLMAVEERQTQLCLIKHHIPR